MKEIVRMKTPDAVCDDMMASSQCNATVLGIRSEIMANYSEHVYGCSLLFNSPRSIAQATPAWF